MARARVARSPARMPRARSEDACAGRVAIALFAARSGTARLFVRRIRQPDREAAVVVPLRLRCPREGEKLLARLDAAAGFVHVLAVGGAGLFVGIRFVDGDDLENALGELVQQREFGGLALLRRHGLDDAVAGLERMHRETAYILHGAAAVRVDRAVPAIGRLLGVVRVALAQAEQLQLEARAEDVSRIGKDRTRRIDAARKRQRAKRRQARADAKAFHSAAALSWPRRFLSLVRSFSAASAITVPGGKIASAPAFISAS